MNQSEHNEMNDEALLLLNGDLAKAEKLVKELTDRVGELETGLDIIMDVLTQLKEEK